MRKFNKVLIAAALSTLPSAVVPSVFAQSVFAQSAFAQAEVQGDVKEDSVLVCATAADAASYAARHKDAIQSSIAGEADEKACVVNKVVYIPGKQSDRIEYRDATYAVTEILIIAVKTPHGVLRTRPNLAYALLRLNETPV
jgi:hypothetical protein